MEKSVYEQIKALVDFGDATFVDDDGRERNIRAVCYYPDGRLVFAEDKANLAPPPNVDD